MLLIDDRVGSGDLLPVVKRLGVPAKLHRMEFGDLAFVGNGPEDLPHQVGLEVKTIGDVVSCMTSGRFAAHQLPGLLRDYDECWLVIEGDWRARHTDGLLQVRHPHKGFWFDLKCGGRRWMWREVQGWVQTMMVLGGIRIWQSQDRLGTARFCAGLYHWWCDKQFHEHKSLKTFVDYKARVGGQAGDTGLLRAPTFERRVYKELPGLGWERSAAAERAFPNLLTAMNADERAWASIDGVGPKTASRIVRAIRGKEWADGADRRQPHNPQTSAVPSPAPRAAAPRLGVMRAGVRGHAGAGHAGPGRTVGRQPPPHHRPAAQRSVAVGRRPAGGLPSSANRLGVLPATGHADPPGPRASRPSRSGGRQ